MSGEASKDRGKPDKIPIISLLQPRYLASSITAGIFVISAAAEPRTAKILTFSRARTRPTAARRANIHSVFVLFAGCLCVRVVTCFSGKKSPPHHEDTEKNHRIAMPHSALAGRLLGLLAALVILGLPCGLCRAGSPVFPWNGSPQVGSAPARVLSQPAATPIEPMPAKQAYPYGWFGPKPAPQWKRSFGVSRAYTQWSRY